VARKARAEAPKSPLPLQNLAVGYAKKGELEKAKTTTAELLRIAPHYRLSNSNIYPIPSSPEAYKNCGERSTCRGQEGGVPE